MKVYIDRDERMVHHEKIVDTLLIDCFKRFKHKKGTISEENYNAMVMCSMFECLEHLDLLFLLREQANLGLRLCDSNTSLTKHYPEVMTPKQYRRITFFNGVQKLFNEMELLLKHLDMEE